ncbi:hypothetical protein REPUB_Repub06bG0107100 [Reevesia pubescens]
MTWALRKNQMSLIRRGLACLSLLLLLLLQFETPCNAAPNGKLNRFKAGSGAGWLSTPHFKSQGGFKGSNTGKDGEDIFGTEKRKVYTGPNPLHNR